MKDATDKPVIVKLTPNANDVVAVARACEEAGADGLTTINTILGMRIDVAKRRPMLGTRSGGLSGPAIRPIAVHLTYVVAQAVSIPTRAVGHERRALAEFSWRLSPCSSDCDLRDPTAPLTVIEGLAAYVRTRGSVDPDIGVAHEAQ